MGEKIQESVEDQNTKYKDGVNKNARLSVKNISFNATEQSLKEHFASYGTIQEVKLLKRPDGRLVGCGFIHYTHVPMANKALKATNKRPFLGRPIYVTWAIPKNKFLEDTKGENEVSKKRKLSVVSHDENDTTVKKKKQEEPQAKVNRNARLIVRNISFKVTEESLKEHFQPYGSINEVNILKKPDGKLVGCAFVGFKNVPMAKNALLNTNMKPFLGRPISVDWAVAKNKYMQHMVNEQLKMEDDIKKEDSDSDEEGPPINLSNDLKEEIKSESEDSDKVKSESDSDSEDEASDDEKNESDDEKSASNDEKSESNDESDEESEDEDMEDDQSMTSEQIPNKRIQLNDAEDGCTVFVTNIPFSVDNMQLQDFAEKTGRIKYALICVDKMTEHSKGTGFIKFMEKSDADKFLSLPSDQLMLEGQLLQVKPALKRENLQKASKKQPKDNRNLYLVKEGVIKPGTGAADAVSVSDMAKRAKLERSKTQMLKNLNRFVSRYRLVVSNLPAAWSDRRLRAACARAAPRAEITEARVMRDLRAPPHQGEHPSKGYGFVMFTKHEDALACLRSLNNNPDVFDKNNRPIVSFSIEDRAALNARKKRLEKSIANNPQAKKNEDNDNKKKKKFKFTRKPGNKNNEAKQEFEKSENTFKPDNKFDKTEKTEKVFQKSGNKFNKSEKTYNRSENKFNRFNRPGNKFNRSENSFERPGNKFNKAANTFDRPGNKFNKAENTFDRPGNKFNKSENTFNKPGNKFNYSKNKLKKPMKPNKAKQRNNKNKKKKP